MHILCIDDDSNFCKMLEMEAKILGIKISFVDCLEQAKQKSESEEFTGQIINSKFLENYLLNNQDTTSLIYRDLPNIQKLKELKSHQQINFIGGQPMSSDEAHYLLAKLCKKANRLEPYCDWLDEIPEKLLADYFRLTYERLTEIAHLIQKIKEDPRGQEWEQLQSIVHKIAGSAGIYGRSMASEICKEMEIRLKAKEYAGLDLDSFYRQLYLYIQ